MIGRRTRPAPLGGRAALGAALVCLCLWGCGYSAGGLLEDIEVRTVAVEVAGNRTFRQRFEAPLTRRILEDLSVHSTVRPARRSAADAILAVEVLDIQGQILSEGGPPPAREGILREAAILVAITAKLLDRRTGRVLREAKIADRAEYRVAAGESLSQAEEESVRDLARRVLLAMEPGF